MESEIQQVAKEVSVWKQALEYAWAPVGALLAIIWKSVNRELKFRREGEIALHAKLDQHIKDDAERFEKMMSQMSSNHAEVLTHFIDLKGK